MNLPHFSFLIEQNYSPYSLLNKFQVTIKLFFDRKKDKRREHGGGRGWGQAKIDQLS